jgi:hypothetical protein
MKAIYKSAYPYAADAMNLPFEDVHKATPLYWPATMRRIEDFRL